MRVLAVASAGLGAAGQWRESARAGSVLAFAFGLFALSDMLWQTLWAALMIGCVVVFALIFAIDIGAGIKAMRGPMDILRALNPFRRRGAVAVERPSDAALGFALFISAVSLMIFQLLGLEMGDWSLAIAPVAMGAAAYNAYRLKASANIGLWCALAPLGAACAQGFARLIGS